MQDTILRVQDLQAEFDTTDGVVNAVNHVSFDLHRGSTLAITGESGSGKSSVALAIMGLLPHPGRITGGNIYFRDRDLLRLKGEELRKIRGREIAIVFQDPSTGLNPVLSIGDQVEEIIRTHQRVSKREAKAMSIDVLGQLGLPDPEEIVRRYPFQLSGGMAQRVMIAIATALNPSVLILDEPTSALDVTVQAAILEDMARLQERHGTSIILISHDLGVVAQMADTVAVMYAGHIAEYADAATLFRSPRHPYTASLLASRPRPDQESSGRLAAIEGAPPSLIDLPDECAFLPRCHKATSECRTERAPSLLPVGPAAHVAACYNPMYREDDGSAARRSA
ncbi:MAG: ABC transporter ATP-binding protein [Chloroflexi bacterium]|nr:ABC transporter ATP-binding protein [Chloroflexota bacterium]